MLYSKLLHRLMGSLFLCEKKVKKLKKKVWIDASEWVEGYNERQLKEWYQDKKKHKKKRDECRLNKFKEKKKREKHGKKKKTIKTSKK